MELCADLLEGGITPSRGMIRQARRIEGIGLNVMIRPRGGDFLFDDDEFRVMEADIDTAKAERADGVVIGLLNADGTIDAARSRELIARARPLSGHVSSRLRHDARPLRGARDAHRTRRGPRTHVRPGSERARRPAAHHRAREARRRTDHRHAGRRDQCAQRRADRQRRAAARDSFRRARNGVRRHAVPQDRCLHGR